MTTTMLFAALSGAAITGGLLIAIAAVTSTGPGPVLARSRWRSRRPAPGGWRRWRWPAAIAAGLLAWLLTGWPVLGLIAVATVVGLPLLLSTSTVAANAIDRVEAVEEWTRRLADVLTVGVGLEQAITSSVRTVAEPIRAEVTALAARVGARWPTEHALRAFADDLADATGDLVVASLILGHRRRGPGLARALTAVADSVAEEVAMRRRVEADRAKPRTTARAVTVITLGVVGLGLLNRSYVAPYGTPLGQLVLAGITTGFVASLAWMRAVTLGNPPPRLLASHPTHWSRS
jgi:Flp pilus assembly protein TadB